MADKLLYFATVYESDPQEYHTVNGFLTVANTLPRILHHPIVGNSISMERALKNVKDHLGYAWTYYNERNDEARCDSVNAAIDDVEAMLAAIK